MGGKHTESIALPNHTAGNGRSKNSNTFVCLHVPSWGRMFMNSCSHSGCRRQTVAQMYALSMLLSISVSQRSLFLALLANLIKSLLPTRMDPIGDPSPFDRQMDTESAPAHKIDGVVYDMFATRVTANQARCFSSLVQGLNQHLPPMSCLKDA